MKTKMKVLSREEMKNVNGGNEPVAGNGSICYTAFGPYWTPQLPGPAAIQCGQALGSACYACERVDA